MKQYTIEINGYTGTLTTANSPKAALQKVLPIMGVTKKIKGIYNEKTDKNCMVAKVSLLGGVRESVIYYALV